MPAQRTRQIITREDGSQWIGLPGSWYRYGSGPWCGTYSGYDKHGCRCDQCKQVQSLKRSRYRASESGKKAALKRQQTSGMIKNILNICDLAVDNEISYETAVRTIIKHYG